MAGLKIFLILATVAYLCFTLFRNYSKGVSLAAMLLVSMPQSMMIVTPGSIPNFPIQRLILMCLTLFWLKRGLSVSRLRRIPFIPYFAAFALSNFISLLGCLDYTLGIKEYLSFTMEVVLFYVIMATSITKRADAFRTLRYVWAGLTCVAILGCIEKQTGFNPVAHIVLTHKEGLTQDVLSTYPHRILFGTAMSMGWPLALGLFNTYKKGRWIYLLSILFFLSSCYFSNSRGPWAGTILAFMALLIIGTRKTKIQLSLIVVLAIVALAVKPGVWNTIYYRLRDTADETSFKGATYRYRWELWKVAFSEISKSPVRLLWGYGPGSSARMSITRVAERGVEHEIWSWDNHYAYFLIETGFLGLILILMLYFFVLHKIYRLWRRGNQFDKGLLSTIIVSNLILLFMMTNVLIFAQQLFYLFWILIAIGFQFGTGDPRQMEMQPRRPRATFASPENVFMQPQAPTETEQTQE